MTEPLRHSTENLLIETGNAIHRLALAFDDEISAVRTERDLAINKCAVQEVEIDKLNERIIGLLRAYETPAMMSTPMGLLPVNSEGMRRLVDAFVVELEEKTKQTFIDRDAQERTAARDEEIGRLQQTLALLKRSDGAFAQAADADAHELFIIANGLWLRRGFHDEHAIVKDLGERLTKFREKYK